MGEQGGLPLDRRRFVVGAVSSGLGIPATMASAQTAAAPAQAGAKACSTGTIPFGAAIRVDLLRDDPDYRRAVLGHCKWVVGEGGLKWIDLRPEPVSYTHLDVYKRQV